jgi:hypothetical protein
MPLIRRGDRGVSQGDELARWEVSFFERTIRLRIEDGQQLTVENSSNLQPVRHNGDDSILLLENRLLGLFHIIV